MFSIKQKKDVIRLLQCSSILEQKALKLYMNLYRRVEHPLMKSTFLYIAIDTLKHTLILREIGKGFGIMKITDKECAKYLGDTWKNLHLCSQTIEKKERLSNEDMSFLVDHLVIYERLLAEEYFITIQFKTVETFTEKIEAVYNMNLEPFKDIFDSIVLDEENHRQFLMNLQKEFGEKETVKYNTPMVKYRNPNAWNGHLI